MPSTLDILVQPLLRNKAGQLKHRFSSEDKLRLLDPTSPLEVTEARLGTYQSLFAFRHSNAIITQRGDSPSSWTALRGRLTLNHITDHLLANRIPTKPPTWVGARSFQWVKWLCVDVDADRKLNPLTAGQRRPQRRPFAERIEQVEAAFDRMGVNARKRHEVLAVPTPSGGRHYYLFLDNCYHISNLVSLLQDAGLTHKQGECEFFPSTKHGLRLPFGHLPGLPDRPQAWIDFIDRYRSGRIRRHSLSALMENAEAHRWASPSQPVAPRSQSGKPSTANAITPWGVPKAVRRRKGKQQAPSGNSTIRSTADARQRWETGITEPGTRTEILMQLAAHLIWFQHHSADEATQQLTDWALNPRHHSSDIQHDLAHGTDTVAKHIERMCHWYAAHKTTTPISRRAAPTKTAKFTQAELDTLRLALTKTPPHDRHEQAEFYLHFLHFAKAHGIATPDQRAWESSPSVRQIIRRWPNCHHMHYRERINRAIDAGILEITKEKWHRPNRKGRARTYQLNVVPKPIGNATIDYDAALSWLSNSTPLVAERVRNDSTIDGEIKHGESNATNQTLPTVCEEERWPSIRTISPALHPPSPRIHLGTGPHQCDQEPNATTILLGEPHGEIRANLSQHRRNRRRRVDRKAMFEAIRNAERHRSARLKSHQSREHP